MSSSELTEAGVFGLEDSLDSSAGSASEIKAFEADTAAPYSRPELLTELKKICVLDELIVKENLKIHELQCSQENPIDELSGSKPESSCTEQSNVSKERMMFWLEMEKEKREVEKLEKSLDNEGTKKTPNERSRKVVKCSIMEKARAETIEDQCLCNELLSKTSNGSQRTRSASLDQNQDTFKTEMGPDVVKEATPHDGVPQCQYYTGSEAKPKTGSLELKEPSEEVGNATKCKLEPLTPEMGPDDGAFDPGGKSILPLVPSPKEASLSLTKLAEHQTPHSAELLDPALSSAAQDLGFVSLDLLDKALEVLPENEPPAVSHNFTLNPNVKEHINNNNNNHPEKHMESLNQLSETSAAPVSLPHTDLHPTMDIKNLSHTDEHTHLQSELQLAPDQPLEFDPGGKEELNKDLPDGVQSFDVMRVSGPGSHGIPVQLNSNIREVWFCKAEIRCHF